MRNLPSEIQALLDDPGFKEVFQALPESAVDSMLTEVMEEARRERKRAARAFKYAPYQGRPVDFGKEVLGLEFYDDVEELMQSFADNQITVARSANGTGKTHAAAQLALWAYKTYPDAQVYITAAPPLKNLEGRLWGELLTSLNGNKHAFIEDLVKRLKVYRRERWFIEGVSIPTTGTAEVREAKFAGKHAPYLFFIVDEGDAVPEEVFRGIESCMSGGMVRLLILFNPRGKQGYPYRLEQEKRAKVVTLSAFDHPNVVTGKDIIPGAVSRDITVRRIHEWTEPHDPREKVDERVLFEVPEFLAGATAVMTDGTILPPLELGVRIIRDSKFFYMVLGEYPPQGENQLIDEQWISQAQSRWQQWVSENGRVPPKTETIIMGQDVAEFGEDSNAIIFRYGNFIDMPITFTGLDVIDAAERGITEYRKAGATIAFVDRTGVGSAVAPYMSKTTRREHIANPAAQRVVAVGVHASDAPTPGVEAEEGEFFSMRDQLFWAVREWLRTDMAMLPPDKLLIDELLCLRYGQDSRGRIKIMKKDDIREEIRRSPDRADALALTFCPRRTAKVRRIGGRS